MNEPLLSVRHVKKWFAVRAMGRPAGYVKAVNDVSLDIYPGETLGIVGESGCGKSMTARAIMRLQAENVQVSGSVRLDGQELLEMSMKEFRTIRGNRMSMIFQEPMTSLNPVFTVGYQLS